METVGTRAKYVRSKNAGPFWVTIDIFAETDEDFTAIADGAFLSDGSIAKIFKVDPELVKVFRLPDLKVIKISVPRSAPQGSKYERDMHSGQQYVQILDCAL